MDTVRGGAAVALHPHRRGTAGEHALNAEAGPGSDTVAEFFEKLIPAVIGGVEQLCGARNIHAAEYKTGLRACKSPERLGRDASLVRALRSYGFPKLFQVLRLQGYQLNTKTGLFIKIRHWRQEYNQYLPHYSLNN